MSTELIIALIGVLSNIITGWTSWFLTRKKYNSEVDNNLINNMKSSLEFYQELSKDNRDRLEETIKRNDDLEKEVEDLRRQMFNLMNSICTDLTCQLRKRNLNLFSGNGTDSRQKI